ncbi:DUF887-domain-containing protein [Artomyces pyxidatus]|uniref:DUF887-domain-containing protein n=1 Tax=Artomyces pyxidatus TaxID=48021 RepID=A0ACB8T847_9AGAM|nr:DUF887-domain-containing protein [Artomyces pyxidatus]
MADAPLPHISPHLSTLVLSVVAFTTLQQLATPLVARALLGSGAWSKLSRRARGGWRTRVVSMAHALLIVPLAFRCLGSPQLDRDRAFGWDDSAGTLYAVTSGYFLWDTVDSLLVYEGVGFVVHGAACFLIYISAFRPFLAYYGARFLLWELSTPFLNIHWFIDKTGRTGSRLQLVNGALLLTTFAVVRLLYGGIMSYQFFQTIIGVRDEISAATFYGYALGNIILQSLNWFWFTRMISALRKRFTPAANGQQNGKHD